MADETVLAQRIMADLSCRERNLALCSGYVIGLKKILCHRGAKEATMVDTI
jgi:hypothetical protein